MNNKEIIMETAMEEFSKYGYENASLNNILKKSDLSKGTFYHYFKSKEELYFKILEKISDIKYGILNEVFSSGDSMKEMDFFDAFEYFLDKTLELMLKNSLLFGFGVNFLKEKGNGIYEKVIEKFNPSRKDMMEKYFDYFYEKTNFRKDISKDSVYKYYRVLLGGLVEIMDAENLKESIDEIRKSIHDILEIAKNGMIKKEHI